MCTPGDRYCFTEQACYGDSKCKKAISKCYDDDDECIFEAVCYYDSRHYYLNCYNYLACEDDVDCVLAIFCGIDESCYLFFYSALICDGSGDEICMGAFLCDPKEY